MFFYYLGYIILYYVCKIVLVVKWALYVKCTYLLATWRTTTSARFIHKLLHLTYWYCMAGITRKKKKTEKHLGKNAVLKCLYQLPSSRLWSLEIMHQMVLWIVISILNSCNKVKYFDICNDPLRSHCPIVLIVIDKIIFKLYLYSISLYSIRVIWSFIIWNRIPSAFCCSKWA